MASFYITSLYENLEYVQFTTKLNNNTNKCYARSIIKINNLWKICVCADFLSTLSLLPQKNIFNFIKHKIGLKSSSELELTNKEEMELNVGTLGINLGLKTDNTRTKIGWWSGVGVTPKYHSKLAV